MKKLLCLLVLLALLAPAAALGNNAGLPVPKFKEVSVHDPSVIRAPDGTFFIYGSHMTAAKSTDLIRWEMFSRNADTGCKLVENVQEEMAEALRYAKTTTFWAPDARMGISCLKRSRSPCSNDLTFIKDYNMVGISCLFHIMRCKEYRHLMLFTQIVDVIPYKLSGLRIKTCRRFIKE